MKNEIIFRILVLVWLILLSAYVVCNQPRPPAAMDEATIKQLQALNAKLSAQFQQISEEVSDSAEQWQERWAEDAREEARIMNESSLRIEKTQQSYAQAQQSLHDAGERSRAVGIEIQALEQEKVLKQAQKQTQKQAQEQVERTQPTQERQPAKQAQPDTDL